MGYIAPLLGIAVAHVVFWYKGNAKVLFDIEWSPTVWWLTTGLLTDCLTLTAWWRLVGLCDVWRAGVLWGVVSLTVDLTLNTLHFGFNARGAIALLLCGVSALLVHR